MVSASPAAKYLSLIKFSHSVFALPFALMAFLVATGGDLRPGVLALVVLAMIAARSAAMAYNRFADRDLDAANPRTASREIPSGQVSPLGAMTLTLTAALAFITCTWFLGGACFWLSFPLLAFLLGYSHSKRFTAWSHLWLGIALGLSPPAAWLAARAGIIDVSIRQPLLLGLGVSLWVAGFDILYSCQDEDFDRGYGLHSLPVKLGRARAMQLAKLFHLLALAAFAGFGLVSELEWLYQCGVLLSAAFLIYEHRLVSPGELGRIGAAFFTMNAIVSLVLMSFALLDLYL
ncbi:MAG: UbiA-like polyprenyltransferase [Planctomycetota bacterium]|jgi:4-hydroxybenzoate polyprenyltransferase